MTERRKRAESIHAEIKRILWEEWDPIGVRGDAPDDEYNAYIGGIHRLLADGADKAAIVEHLYRLETEYMGLRGDKARLGPVAESLLKVNLSL